MAFGVEANFEKAVRQAVISGRAYERLENGLPDFWRGADIPVKEKQVVAPKTQIFSEIILSKENFPPVEIDRGVLRVMNLSTRSRLAQAGIEIRIDCDRIGTDDIESANRGKKVAVSAMIENHGERAVEFEGDATRFFWANERKRLAGKELREVVVKDVKIEGENGKDWFIADAEYGIKEDDDMIRMNMDYEEFRKKTRDIMIVFPMKQKLYIPKNDKPLRIASRKDLEDALKSVPKDHICDFCLGETPYVEFGEETCGVINTGSYGGGKRHLASPFIDPGFKGRIRTELLNNLEYIELYLYKKKRNL